MTKSAPYAVFATQEAALDYAARYGKEHDRILKIVKRDESTYSVMDARGAEHLSIEDYSHTARTGKSYAGVGTSKSEAVCAADDSARAYKGPLGVRTVVDEIRAQAPKVKAPEEADFPAQELDLELEDAV